MKKHRPSLEGNSRTWQLRLPLGQKLRGGEAVNKCTKASVVVKQIFFLSLAAMNSAPRRCQVPSSNPPIKQAPLAHLLLKRKTKQSLVPPHCPAGSEGSVVFVQ